MRCALSSIVVLVLASCTPAPKDAERTATAERLPPPQDVAESETAAATPQVKDGSAPRSLADYLAEAAKDAPPSDGGGGGNPLLGVSVQSCRTSDGPKGAGHVSVTFDGSGRPPAVVLDHGPFAGTAVGDCIRRRFEAVVSPRFDGGAVRLGKSFAIN